MKHPVIQLTNVFKTYPSYKKNASYLSSNKPISFQALKNINLTIQKGDRVGIVGSNGSGKTTLLKLIAGIIQPSSGTVNTQGKIVSLMQIDAGFHPDLSGKENIMINGLLVGMTKKEIQSKYNSIVKFSGIEDFIDAPFYTYSDGMKFRLAFAVAIASSCDILIIDEVFLAGDTNFQLKTLSSIKEIQKNSKATIVICSHVLTHIIALSNKFYSLNKGVLKKESVKGIMKKLKSQDTAWKKRLGVTFGYAKNSN